MVLYTEQNAWTLLPVALEANKDGDKIFIAHIRSLSHLPTDGAKSSDQAFVPWLKFARVLMALACLG